MTGDDDYNAHMTKKQSIAFNWRGPRPVAGRRGFISALLPWLLTKTSCWKTKKYEGENNDTKLKQALVVLSFEK